MCAAPRSRAPPHALLRALRCRYEAYCSSSDFIREHIFPGGHLPSVGAMVEAARGTGLSLQETTDIGGCGWVHMRGGKC